MIGVNVSAADKPVACELFELLKTPWEFARPDRDYDVLLSNQAAVPSCRAALRLQYVGPAAPSGPVAARFDAAGHGAGGDVLPLPHGCSFPTGAPFAGVVDQAFGRSLAVVNQLGSGLAVTVGFDLLREVRTLLSAGQSAESAATPTLELHLELLRHLITSAGLPLVEIPPVPAGSAFLACLTHDVDHPVLRAHRCDHTLAGFLLRATLGSVHGLVRGRLSGRQLLRNWSAAASLPLLHAGLVPDPWRRSLTGYRDLERAVGSTFFVIPFKGRPGRSPNGRPNDRRAAAYDPDDIAAELGELHAADCEIAVHGLDAWCDAEAGVAERRRLAPLAGTEEFGVRMHWLYFAETSPAVLEQAGFTYDSSVGFNQTVGFRAGTLQVYRPLNATRLLELPLHVMDTSLFYPDYLDLAPAQARARVGALLDQAVRFGGVFTVNWHDRSIAPERLWDEFYRWLLAELRSRGAWFSTARQAVAWFRRRRAVRFAFEQRTERTVKLRLETPPDADGPPLRLRVHRPSVPGQPRPPFVEVPVCENEMAIAF